ncbi:hypothetical protein GGS21DRAFT_175778 [Xylaria nigripes]|nr:hypothetical protein GGS21DRAFT_175778 [Xylaria nigripes]
MTSPTSITPEPEASGRAIARDSPDESPQVNDVKVQHEDHDAPIQSPRPASRDKPAEEVSVAKPDDSGDSDSKDTTVQPADSVDESTDNTTSGASKLPTTSPAAEQDDGWACHWDPAHQAWFFYNSITNESTWENPRVPSQAQGSAAGSAATAAPAVNAQPPAGGYNPAIHGDYDPNAWYAKNNQDDNEDEVPVMDTATAYAAIGSFNRFTGGWQGDEQGPDRHNDESKSRRQMNAFFDVDAAANAHNGRSLKAERAGKKPTKTELKQFKEKRRARKEEKRRAWLRD